MSTRSKDLGPVTAYAYAVAGGYRGTEEEFEELLGDIAEDLSNIENLSVTVTTLPAGSSATASYRNGVLSLGIPKGDKGDQGDEGDQGPQGVSIGSVVKTGTSGNVDTYTIYSDEPTPNILGTFTVTNSNVSSVNDQTGTVVLDAGDLEYDSSETYTSGSIGEAISDIKSNISNATDNQFIELDKGKFRRYTSIFTQENDVDYVSCLVECSSSDVFNIKGYGGAVAALQAFAKSDGTIIERGGTYQKFSDFYRLVAPAESAYFVFNSNITQTSYPPAVIKGEYIPSSIDTVESVLETVGTETIQWEADTIRDRPTPLIGSYYAAWSSVLVPCSPGDVFLVKGSGGNSSRLWMFTDNTGTLVEESAAGLQTADYIRITAPTGAAYLACNSRSAQAGYPFSLVRVWSLAQRLDSYYERVTFTADKMVQGNYTTGAGLPYITESSTRIRMMQQISVYPGDVLRFTGGTNVERYLVGYFGKDGRLISETSWIYTSELALDSVTGCKYIVVLFARANKTALTPEQFDATCGIYTLADEAGILAAEDTAYDAIPVTVQSHETRLAQMSRYGKGTVNARDPQFMLITDTHGDMDAMYNAVRYANKYSNYFDALVHCGDFVPNGIPIAGNAGTLWFADAIKDSNVPVYMVIGNHESGTYANLMYTPTDEMLYNLFVKPIVDKGWLSNGEYTENKCYYYHDFTSSKIRLIVPDQYESDQVLDTTYWTAITYNSSYSAVEANTEYTTGDKVNVPGYTAYSFEAAQSFNSGTYYSGKWPKYKIGRGDPCPNQASAQWFLDTLCTTPKDYGVVVAVHAPFSLNVSRVTTSKFCQDPSSYAAESSQINEDFYADAVNAFVNGSNFSETLTYKNGMASVTVSKDFSTKNSGVKFLCYVGGHWHEDLVFKHNTYNQYEIAPIDGNSMYAPQNAHSDICRTFENGAAKDSITTVAFKDGALGLSKLGVDITITGKYRDFEVLDISGA